MHKKFADYHTNKKGVVSHQATKCGFYTKRFKHGTKLTRGNTPFGAVGKMFDHAGRKQSKISIGERDH